MAPRADFSCRSCAKAAGEDGLHVHEDLPIDSKRCPISGAKIHRLFNAVNIGNPDARAHAKIIENSTIPAQMDAAAAAPPRQRNENVLNIGSANALASVQGFPGATQGSRQAVGLLKSLTPPRPT